MRYFNAFIIAVTLLTASTADAYYDSRNRRIRTTVQVDMSVLEDGGQSEGLALTPPETFQAPAPESTPEQIEAEALPELTESEVNKIVLKATGQPEASPLPVRLTAPIEIETPKVKPIPARIAAIKPVGAAPEPEEKPEPQATTALNLPTPITPEKPAEPVAPVQTPAPQKRVTAQRTGGPTQIDYSRTKAQALPTDRPDAPVTTAPQQEQAPMPVLNTGNITQLVFGTQSSALAPGQTSKLLPLIDQLNAHDQVRLQLRAYASDQGGMDSAARRLSLSRALSVRSYLMDQGIRPTRVDVRALGANIQGAGPADRVDVQLIN